MRNNFYMLFQPRRFFFVISLNYKKSLQEVEKYLPQHREYLDHHYKQGVFLASGPKVPRTGGVILSPLTSKLRLEEILSKDPFYTHGIAEYEIMEFQPTKHQKSFSACLDRTHGMS